MKDLALKLRLLRIRAGLNQEYVAGYLGVTDGTLSHYETGRIAPSIARLERLVMLYGSTLSAFFAWTLSRAERREVLADLAGDDWNAEERLRRAS